MRCVGQVRSAGQVTHLLLVSVLVSSGQGTQGQLFDAEIYPPEMSSLPHLLSPEELLHYFGVIDPAQVDKGSYSIVEMTSVLREERVRAKRSGEKPADRAYRISAFGNTYNLRMKRNNNLLAKNATITVKEGNHTYTEHITASYEFPEEDDWIEEGWPEVAWLEMEEDEEEECDNEDGSAFCGCEHFIDRSFAETLNISAVVSDCWEDEDYEDSFYNSSNSVFYGKHKLKHDSGWRDISGIIFSPEGAFEIYSVPPKVAELIHEFRSDLNATYNFTLPSLERGSQHILFKKASFPVEESEEHLARSHLSPENPAFQNNSRTWTTKEKRSGEGKLFIEVGLFMDEPAYTNYYHFFEKSGHSNPYKRIVQLLLAYMNSIQAIYHFDSLGTKVDFSIVHMEIMRTQPEEFNEHGGDRGPLLTSFCKYQGSQNTLPEDSPHHWDIGLLVSGVDFWAADSNGKNYLTMGLATVTGICTKSYGCVIGEMGVRDRNDKPYPSTGFTSVYVMAHEIGHNLGMSHDSSGNSCPSNGFVMSPSRGTKGEVVWSECSRKHMSKLVDEQMDCLVDKPGPMEAVNELHVNHNTEYQNYPGGVWDAHQQCQALMFDKDAHVDHDPEDPRICYSMKCRSPNRRGYYRAGPALEGTTCGTGKICHEGECVTNKISPGEYLACTWSEWTSETCKSGCIKGSKGFVSRTRNRIQRKAPLTKGPREICAGKTTEIKLCEDPCSNTVLKEDYAKSQCTQYLEADPRLEAAILKLGLQPHHDERRPDVACTVHCKRTGGGTGDWHSLVYELGNRDDLDVYFPDGTFCHRDGADDYFCREHKCVSSDSRGGRAEPLPNLEVNGGASPDGNNRAPEEVDKYFSLDAKGKPLSDNFRPKDDGEVPETMWTLDHEVRP